MSKHKLLILISIIVFTGLNEVVAQTAYDFYEKNDDGVEIYYKYISSSNLQVEVTPKPSGQLYTGNIRIPSTVTHNSQSYSVVGIGLQAFASCKGLTSVEIPNSVTQIGQLAFSACTSLTNFNFPNALISIGPDAFNGSAITSVWIPNSVESIGQMAFANCSNLKTIRFPENDKFTSIPAKCVMKGTRLESAILPANITSLADYAFWECTSLNYVFCEGNILNEIGDKRQCFGKVPGTCRLIVPQGFTTSTIELTKVYGKGAFLFDSTTDIN
ncbi:MAG: leucine-rich repeat domain-containing protein, partial [Veillonella sp.]|nr:leucine-rich repeat domain-containing protein [Veillonella sp.]